MSNYPTKASRKQVGTLVLVSLLVTAGIKPDRYLPKRYRGIKALTTEDLAHLQEIEARSKDLIERTNHIVRGRLMRPLMLLAVSIRYISGKNFRHNRPRNDR